MKDWLHADQLSDKELSFIIAKDDVIEGSYEPTMNTFIHNYKTAAYNIDSNIPNTLFVQALYDLEFASLLILVIVLANTFAMEKHYQTYQIMIPTAAGNKRITTAKISAGILLALGIVLIQFLLYNGLYISAVKKSAVNLLLAVNGSAEQCYRVCFYV